jgi:hypothetical protein
LLTAAESRKVIISLEDTPSASGTLLGSELITCLFVQEPRVKQRINAIKNDLCKFFSIGPGLMSYGKQKLY